MHRGAVLVVQVIVQLEALKVQQVFAQEAMPLLFLVHLLFVEAHLYPRH